MFSAGMGTDIQELKHSGKAGFLVALLGVLVPLALGTGLAVFAARVGMIAYSGFLEAVFIGTVLTATSVSITVETLKELGKLETKVGNTILAAALIDDVLGLIALTIVSSVAGGQESILLVLVKIVLFFVFAGGGLLPGAEVLPLADVPVARAGAAALSGAGLCAVPADGLLRGGVLRRGGHHRRLCGGPCDLLHAPGRLYPVQVRAAELPAADAGVLRQRGHQGQCERHGRAVW